MREVSNQNVFVCLFLLNDLTLWSTEFGDKKDQKFTLEAFLAVNYVGCATSKSFKRVFYVFFNLLVDTNVKIQQNAKKSHFYLHISKKSSTFAADFRKRTK